MESYKAIVCTEPGRVEVQEKPLTDLGPNDIRVRTQATLISPGTERANILNMANTKGAYPHEPGYSVAGVVEEIGSKVTRFKPGDRVTGRAFGHRSAGNTREDRVVAIPDNVSYEEASFCTVGSVALQGVRKAHIEIGEHAMVLGLGLIGGLAAQLCAVNGAFPVIGVDRSEVRLKKADACGVDLTIDSSQPGWQDILLKNTEGKGPQIVIEATGAAEAIPDALKSARMFGRVVLLASTRGESQVNFHYDVHSKAISIIGAQMRHDPHHGYWTWLQDAACFMELLSRRKINLQPLITERIPWTKAEETYQQMLAWNSNMIGTVINWNE
jgi:2-desacetyl-2-hydroxyethyl bacteriochlorophyllide A dehydrogenase